jgi:hypothetical protein
VIEPVAVSGALVRALDDIVDAVKTSVLDETVNAEIDAVAAPAGPPSASIDAANAPARMCFIVR